MLFIFNLKSCLRQSEKVDIYLWLIVVVQSLSSVCLFATPWTAAHLASLSFTVSRSLLKIMSIESVMPSNHLILCHPLHILSSIFPGMRVFSNESLMLSNHCILCHPLFFLSFNSCKPLNNSPLFICCLSPLPIFTS